MGVWDSAFSAVGAVASVGATICAGWSIRLTLNVYKDEKNQKILKKKQDWFSNVIAKRILTELDIIISSYLNAIQEVRTTILDAHGIYNSNYDDKIKTIYSQVRLKIEALKIVTYTLKIVNYNLHRNMLIEIEGLEDEFAEIINKATQKHFISDITPENNIKKFSSNIIEMTYKYDINES